MPIGPNSDLTAQTAENLRALANLAVGQAVEWDGEVMVERHGPDDVSIRRDGDIIDRGSDEYIAEELIWDGER